MHPVIAMLILHGYGLFTAESRSTDSKAMRIRKAESLKGTNLLFLPTNGFWAIYPQAYPPELYIQVDWSCLSTRDVDCIPDELWNSLLGLS